MKKIGGSLFLKMLAFVVVCILVPIFAISTLCAIDAYESGMYRRAVTYNESNICRDFINENLAQIREYIYWEDIAGLDEHKYYTEHSNFAFVIRDNNKKVVYSTLREGFELVVKDYPAKEVTEEGKTVAEYTIDGYISKIISDRHEGYKEYSRYYFYKQHKTDFFYYMAFSFVISAVLCIYLISFAGIDEKGELDLKGINAVDYDILMGLSFGGTVGLCALLLHVWNYQYDDIYKLAFLMIIIAGITAIVLTAAISSTAHFKMKKWWHHTFIWQCFDVFGRFFRWVMSNIGIGWKLALCVFGYSLVILFLGMLAVDNWNGIFFFLFALMIITGAVCVAIWFGSQLKKIKRGGEAIANGDFDYSINSAELWPMLRMHAYNLNCAAKGMSKAVDDRMKSERFKTELITNVSHDLKTPLTSIVSYVDLLKKENIENETAVEYIEVIDRQSAKLKKLTEDLVEASKVSSGALAVNKELLNIGELVNQSVGEFSEKLEAAEITPVVNLPEEEIFVNTDGRLLWRVFDNLIQNIIKYAQPGTRAYFDLSEAEEAAVLTIRNISKEPLNMTAEALMERFVRGDASRGGEGNGLGLSIAKSLTELCGGTFELTLDGDLYKVTIKIPKTETEEN